MSAAMSWIVKGPIENSGVTKLNFGKEAKRLFSQFLRLLEIARGALARNFSYSVRAIEPDLWRATQNPPVPRTR